MAQECIHSVKVKDLSAVIMKIDLEKAYDRVDWDYLRFILLQIGLSYDIVKWIMACISSTNFTVLVNGSLTQFFNGNLGL